MSSGRSPRSGALLQHVPDLVRYGSKPMREQERLPELLGALRTYEQALAYPPHQVFIGNPRPEELWELPRPWWRGLTPGRPGQPQRDRRGPVRRADAAGGVLRAAR